MAKNENKFLKTAFVLYVLIMLWLLFGQRLGWEVNGDYWENVGNSYNLEPFLTIGRFIRSMINPRSKEAIFEAVKNILDTILQRVYLMLLLFESFVSILLHLTDVFVDDIQTSLCPIL